jgi:hypothetical protein
LPKRHRSFIYAPERGRRLTLVVGGSLSGSPT